jgi:AAA domain
MDIPFAVARASVARFPTNLALPECPQQWVAEAAEAVRREYRNSVKWKRLRCRTVAPLEGQADNSIFVLDLGHAIEFDWTWEGAVAFRPADLNGFNGDIDFTDDFTGTLSEKPVRASVWSGEVVEVDQTKGQIFVSVSTPDNLPCCGSFYVRPFEFLAFLYSIYCQPEFTAIRQLLGRRLNACRGNVHPVATARADTGLEELKALWKYGWGILWGPPGTGKTHTLGKQVASCLTDPSERILVISTTNRATDAAAIAIGRSMDKAQVEEGRALRIGKSAGYAEYQGRGLEGMLRGTETDLLHQISLLSSKLDKAANPEERAVLRKHIQELRRCMKDSAFNIFGMSAVSVVIGTAFKILTLVADPTIRASLAAGETPFTTVVIDEAGLLSRAAAAVLSLLASRRVLVVGDSKQLAPISRISRILPTSQSIWLASSPLSHLQYASQVEAGVHLLSEQHRMHPSVCRVVSEFQYDGQLRDAKTVLDRDYDLPPLLRDQSRAIWYVLDEDTDDIPSIRAERGPGNRSWLRPRTRSVLKKLFSDPLMAKVQGIFVSPFTAQARDIARFFAEERLDNWTASTVHSQQGTEADFVIFDTVNAGSCGWPPDEWKRLVNVGLSRAKEFMLLLSSRAEMSEPFLRPLLKSLAPRVLAKSGKTYEWKEVPVQVSFEVSPQIAANPDLLGNQLGLRKSLRPILSKEQQRLCGLDMDGKPRLVRGVAGSGKTVVLAHWLQKTVKQLAGKLDCKVWGVYANMSLARLITDTIEEAWSAENKAQAFP